MFRKLIQKVNFKKTLRLLPFGFFILVLFAIPHVAFAEEKSWWENLGAFFSLLYKFGANPIDGLLAILSQALLSIAGFIFFLVAGIFNATIQYTLIDLSQNLDGISAITIAWGVIRDLINMSFIFILLYIAIGTILDIGINWKNTLVKVVITAILINFSLFFTKVVIDASNLLALTFYNSFSNGTASSIASGFTNALKITSLYGNISTALDGSALQLMTAGLVGTIFLLITCFVFLVATFLFLSRFVTIIFLLILSPIGFFGSVLPGLGGAASKWRDTLIGQALFAPIYMILTWITLQIVNDPGFKAPVGSKLSDAFSITASGLPPGGSTGGFMDLFMNYIIITIFMIAAIVIAKQAANRGGSAIGQKLVGGAFGIGAASGAWAGRRTLGWVANTADKKGYLRGVDRAAAGKGFAQSASEGFSQGSGVGGKLRGGLVGLAGGARTYAARAAGATVRGTATGSLDVRKGINTVGGVFGFKNASGELGFGDQLSGAGTGGYVGMQEKKKKALDERTQRAQMATAADQVEAGVAAQQDSAFESAKAAVLAGTATQAQKDLVAVFDTMEKTIARMTDKEVEALVESNKKLLNEQSFTTMLSSRQLEALDKSDKFTEQEKNTLKRTRFASAESIASRDAADIGAASQVQNLTDKELEMIDPVMLENEDFVSQLKQSQVEAITKSNRFTTTQKGTVKRLRKNAVEAKLRANPALIKKTHAKELAEYGAANPGDLLIDPAIMSEYDPKVLKRLGNELNDEKSAQLRSAILASKDPALKSIQDWLDTPAGVSAL